MTVPAFVRNIKTCLTFSRPPGSRRISPTMFTYSKLAQGGIAAVSYLASIHPEQRLTGSLEIATNRDLSRALVAKILTKLSAAGLVGGKPGPTGGYQLTRPPSEISLLDVVAVFDDLEQRVMCPFGPHWCDTGPKCPVHDLFFETHDRLLALLGNQNFAQFGNLPVT